MPKICKKGKIVVLLNGRYAGRKAIIVKVNEDGTKDQKFANGGRGIDRYPRKVTRAMKADRIKKRPRSNRSSRLWISTTSCPLVTSLRIWTWLRPSKRPRRERKWSVWRFGGQIQKAGREQAGKEQDWCSVLLQEAQILNFSPIHIFFKIK